MPPPYQPYQPYNPQGATGSVDLGAAFNWTFAKLQQFLPVWLGLAGVVLAVRVVGYFASRAITDAMVADCVVNEFGFENCDGGSFFAGLGAAVLSAIIFGIAAALLSIGVQRAALKATRGEAPSFDHLTSTEFLGAYVVTAILSGLATFVGLALCIIPGLLAIFFLQFAPLASLDRGDPVGTAFSRSSQLAMANVGPCILLLLINFVSAFLQGVLFGILTIVLLPISTLLTAHVFRQAAGEPVAA